MLPIAALHFLLVLSSQNDAAPQAAISLADAMTSTLRRHPLLRVQEQQVQYSRGAVLRAQAQFDRVLSADASHSRTYTPLNEVERTLYGATSATTNVTTLDAAATQQFRNGISAGPLLNVTRTSDNIFTLNGLNQAHIGFQVNIPMLRGRGRDVVAAQETASGMEAEASLLDLNQTISDLLFNTAVSYWTAAAARRSLEVYREAEARGRVMLDTVSALIDADKIPRSDVSEVQANLADRIASRIAADRNLFQAKQQLAVATGESGDGLTAQAATAGGDASDKLPEVPATAPPAEDVPAMIAQSLTRRADYLAARKRQAEAEVLAGAAKNQLKPQLDLQFSTGYSGLKDGNRPDQFLLSTVGGVHGVDAVGGIRYQFPLENRAAEGAVLQARSTALQADYRRQDAARNVASAVIVALDGVRSAARQLEQVNESVALFRTALENEREKYRLGVGSLVEMLTVEDRLTGVLVSQVQSELGYAIALARLRQSTGTIVEPDQAVQNVNPGVFLTLPGVKH
jgi:outer membrane protein TolC